MTLALVNGFEPRTGSEPANLAFLYFLLSPFYIMRDYFDVDKLGVFEAYCYKKAHLNELTYHQIALLHYLLIGECRGLREWLRPA